MLWSIFEERKLEKSYEVTKHHQYKNIDSVLNMLLYPILSQICFTKIKIKNKKYHKIFKAKPFRK